MFASNYGPICQEHLVKARLSEIYIHADGGALVILIIDIIGFGFMILI